MSNLKNNTIIGKCEHCHKMSLTDGGVMFGRQYTACATVRCDTWAVTTTLEDHATKDYTAYAAQVEHARVQYFGPDWRNTAPELSM